MLIRPKRRRATAIIEYPAGILLTHMRGMAPALPGGGIKPGESDEAAVIREVLEETSLQVVHALFLFHFETFAHQHAVFWIIPTGIPQASQEVDALLYYTPEKLIRVSPETYELLKYFHRYRFDNPDNFGYNPNAPNN